MEYHHTFIRLLKYVPNIASNLEKKLHNFINGLNYELCIKMNILNAKMLQKAYKVAKKEEINLRTNNISNNNTQKNSKGKDA